MSVENVLSRILEIEHGFQHIIDGTNEILSSNSKEQCFKYAITLLEHKTYQARMLATSILGKLATTDKKALYFLKEQVSFDKKPLTKFASTKDMNHPYLSLKNG